MQQTLEEEEEQCCVCVGCRQQYFRGGEGRRNSRWWGLRGWENCAWKLLVVLSSMYEDIWRLWWSWTGKWIWYLRGVIGIKKDVDIKSDVKSWLLWQTIPHGHVSWFGWCRLRCLEDWNTVAAVVKAAVRGVSSAQDPNKCIPPYMPNDCHHD